MNSPRPVDVAHLRGVLVDAVQHGRSVIITSTRHGTACAARGKITSVNGSHVIISWRSGQSIIPIDSITNIAEVAGDS